MTDIKKPVKRRETFYEPYFSYEEIAREMNCTVAGVQQIEQRALKKISEAFQLLDYLKKDFL